MPVAALSVVAGCCVDVDGTGCFRFAASLLVASVPFAPQAGNASAEVNAAIADAIRSLFMFTSGTM